MNRTGRSSVPRAWLFGQYNYAPSAYMYVLRSIRSAAAAAAAL